MKWYNIISSWAPTLCLNYVDRDKEKSNSDESQETSTDYEREWVLIIR